MRTVYPIGTTIYQPDRCCNGYTIVWDWTTCSVGLIDMNGRTAHGWQVEQDPDRPIDRARLLPNGNVLMQLGTMQTETGQLLELDWEGNLAWEWIPEGTRPHPNLLGPHHDVFRKSNGNTLTICRERVPEELLDNITEPSWRGETIFGDAIVEIDPAGDVVWVWHAHHHLDLNHPRIIASPEWPPGQLNSTVCDWTHVNTVRDLPENKWFDAGDQRFRPGNVLISPRQLDTIYLIDRQSGEIVWDYSGDYFGGLSGQHEPVMIEPGKPGAGNILIFDNGASPTKDLGHAGASYVLEIDPTTKKLVWVYDKWMYCHSPYTSSAERLANGNTLICEALNSRTFEVTPEGETVWEHIGPANRAYRYAYDYCPQLAALGTPDQRPVVPPSAERFRIEPQ